MELGKKVDTLNASAERAEKRLGLVEEKLNAVLDRLDKAPTAAPAPAAAPGPVGDDGEPWTMTYQTESDGKEHFYVKDKQGRSRHFERPVAQQPTAPAAQPPAATATTTTYYAPPPATTSYYAPAPAVVASPGYYAGAAPAYTSGAVVVRRGLFGGRGYRTVCNGTSCSLVPN